MTSDRAVLHDPADHQTIALYCFRHVLSAVWEPFGISREQCLTGLFIDLVSASFTADIANYSRLTPPGAMQLYHLPFLAALAGWSIQPALAVPHSPRDESQAQCKKTTVAIL